MAWDILKKIFREEKEFDTATVKLIESTIRKKRKEEKREVDLKGKTIIVEFGCKYFPPCDMAKKIINESIAGRDDVIFETFDITFGTKKEYKVLYNTCRAPKGVFAFNIPYIIILDKDRNEVGYVAGNKMEELRSLLEKT